jgi:hypothetical protein
VRPTDLVAGQAYFKVGYEDERLTRIVIQSYEYLGKQVPSEFVAGEPAWRFRPLDPFTHEENVYPYDGEFEFTERHLDAVCDLAGLIQTLERIMLHGPDHASLPDAP